MIVVHPDEIVVLQHRRELAREYLIDAQVAVEIAAPQIGKVEPVVEQRP